MEYESRLRKDEDDIDIIQELFLEEIERFR